MGLSGRRRSSTSHMGNPFLKLNPTTGQYDDVRYREKKPKTEQKFIQEENRHFEVPVDEKKEKMLEVLKDSTLGKKEEDKQFNNLYKLITDQQKTIDLLRDDIKLLTNNITEQHSNVDTSQDEYEFVESVETENSGGNVMLDIIRFKHSDVVIVVGDTGMTIWENDEDYREWNEKKLLFDLEFEEMEKIEIEDLQKKRPIDIDDDFSDMDSLERINNITNDFQAQWDADKTITEAEASKWLNKQIRIHPSITNDDEAEIWQFILKNIRNKK